MTRIAPWIVLTIAAAAVPASGCGEAHRPVRPPARERESISAPVGGSHEALIFAWACGV